MFCCSIVSVLGHEGVVQIIDHHRPDSDLSVGDRITFCICDSCYACERCQDGIHQKCVSLFKVFFNIKQLLSVNTYLFKVGFNLVL